MFSNNGLFSQMISTFHSKKKGGEIERNSVFLKKEKGELEETFLGPVYF